MLTSVPAWYNIQTLMSDEQKNNDWKERELGALWVKKSLTGTQYMTGHIELKDASGKVQLVVFKNKHKYKHKSKSNNTQHKKHAKITSMHTVCTPCPIGW